MQPLCFAQELRLTLGAKHLVGLKHFEPACDRRNECPRSSSLLSVTTSCGRDTASVVAAAKETRRPW